MSPQTLAAPAAAWASSAAAPPSRAVVLGAGTMGARIAALFANAGLEVDLLDVPGAAGARNAAAERGLRAAAGSKPAAFEAAEVARRVRIGNFADDLDVVAAADWVIEAVIEDLGAKRDLLARVAPRLRADAVLSTNTSGLPVAAVGAELPAAARRRWLGTHFFNPPRYLRLLELIPTPETDPEVVARVAGFADLHLGKGVVHAKDTPNFVANRIGVFAMLTTLRIMEEMSLSVEEVDALTGPALGWPKSATFRTADLVGLDLFAHVVENSYNNLPADEEREVFRAPALIRALLERGWLGEKAGQGFYKKGGKRPDGEREILALDPKTLEYHPRRRVQFPSLELSRNIPGLGERLRAVVFGAGGDAAGEFLWRLLSRVLVYAAARVPEIADQPYEVDRAMRWGFGWRLGPFELWDALGVEAVARRLEREKTTPPAYVTGLLAGGGQTFYRETRGGREAAQPPRGAGGGGGAAAGGGVVYARVPEPAGGLDLDRLRRNGAEIRRNDGCSLLDLGDGVGCLEFHAKMNAIGADIVGMVTETLSDPRSPFQAFVIGNEAENFSAGANLLLLLLSIQEEEWEDVELMIRSFQGMTQAVKRSPRPVVAAPAGLALGGGCELGLHAARVVAHAELYTGLVELGVGLIPGGGGTKEMALRASRDARRVRDGGDKGSESVEALDAFKRAFEMIALAKVSTSAVEAREMGLIGAAPVIARNRDRLLAAAKAEALRLAGAGYAPPAAATIYAPGPNVRATLELGVHLMRRADFITDYEQKLGRVLAGVLCGGDAPAGAPLTEERMLELEREAFVSLCGEAKTRERIQHTLKTGKPLRN